MTIELIETIDTTETPFTLTDPALLYRIGQKLEMQGYIGELQNKLATYLAGTTKDYKRDERIGIIIKGEPGGGKSTLLDVLEKYFADCVKSYHRMTAHAPDYWAKEIGTLDGKILIIKQMDGAEAIQYTIQIMVDPVANGLKILTTSGTPGNMETREISLSGLPVMCSTTVNFQMDNQILRRFYTIYPDDSPDQTLKIDVHKGKLRQDPTYRNMIKSTDQDLVNIPIQLKTESAKFGVIIPFAEYIAKERFPTESLLARSDIDKFFNFITAVTHLYYKQRLSFIDCNGKVQLIASPIDYYYTWQIVKESLPKRLSGITDERSYRIFMIVQKECIMGGSVDITDVMKLAYAEGMNYSRNTIWCTLADLRDRGYVQSEVNPNDKRKRLWNLTGKSYEPFGITFPDENIENLYIQFVAKNIGSELSKENWELLGKSMRAVDLVSGKDITAKIVSEKSRSMLKL